MQETKSIGIDLGKTIFHLALGIHSQVLVRRKFSRQRASAVNVGAITE